MSNAVKESYEVVMDAEKNPLKELDIEVKHFIMQVLGWMWSMIFCLSFYTIVEFGIVWLSHVAIIFGITMTMVVFKRAEKEAKQKR